MRVKCATSWQWPKACNWEDSCTGARRVQSSEDTDTHADTHRHTDTQTHPHCIDSGCGCLRGRQVQVVHAHTRCGVEQSWSTANVERVGQPKAQGLVDRATSVATRDGYKREQSRKRRKCYKTNEFPNIEAGLLNGRLNDATTNGSALGATSETSCSRQNAETARRTRRLRRKNKALRKTEGIPPWTNTPSCNSEEGGRPQNMSEQSGRKVD